MQTAEEFEKLNVEVIEKIESGLRQQDDASLNIIIQALQKAASLAISNCTGTHLPNLDRILAKTANIIRGQQRQRQSSSGKTIILVSELYTNGGHTRITEDIVNLVPGEVLIVITDYTGNYANGKLALSELYERFRGVSVLTLPAGTHIAKVLSLTNVINLVSPDKLYLLLHHDDSIGYVAAFAHNVSGLKSFFIHHADHNPTLGATLRYEKHLDTTKEYSQKCKELNCYNCDTLPLYVKDKGAKTANLANGFVNFASVGSHNKFTFEGSLDHATRIINCLKFDTSRFFHIGPLSENSLKKINTALSENGMKSERFKHIHHVPSVWQAFLELDVHALIGAAPLGGGRTAIEAQGAGVPVLWYHDKTVKSMYEAQDLSWDDQNSLDIAILKVMKNYFEYSKNARKFYEKFYNEDLFKKSLGF